MLLLTLSALIPPPPDWTPPRASGPGNLCGTRFTLAMVAGETVRADWPGEIFINDVFGTYRVTTPAGEVVITENGSRTRPTGHSHPFEAGAVTFSAYADGAYAFAVQDSETVKAVTVRFPDGTSEEAARALLSRMGAGRPAADLDCLSPENR